MPTKNLKLLALLIIGLVLLACAHRDPLQLPQPMMSDDPGSGWRNY